MNVLKFFFLVPQMNVLPNILRVFLLSSLGESNAKWQHTHAMQPNATKCIQMHPKAMLNEQPNAREGATHPCKKDTMWHENGTCIAPFKEYQCF